MSERSTQGMTLEELNALPEQALFDEHDYVLTSEDVENKVFTFQGKVFPLFRPQIGDIIHIPVARKGYVMPFSPEDVAIWTDKDGVTWTPGLDLDTAGNKILCKRRAL